MIYSAVCLLFRCTHLMCTHDHRQTLKRERSRTPTKLTLLLQLNCGSELSCGCSYSCGFLCVPLEKLDFMRSSDVFNMEFITESWLAADTPRLYPINNSRVLLRFYPSVSFRHSAESKAA